MFATQNEGMFEGIDYDNKASTNRWLELFTEHMVKMQQLDPDIYEPSCVDISKCSELYALTVDNEIKYVSQCLIPLVSYVAKEIKWRDPDVEWSIDPIKTEN